MASAGKRGRVMMTMTMAFAMVIAGGSSRTALGASLQDRMSFRSPEEHPLCGHQARVDILARETRAARMATLGKGIEELNYTLSWFTQQGDLARECGGTLTAYEKPMKHWGGRLAVLYAPSSGGCLVC